MALRDAREWLAETLEGLAALVRQRPVEVPTPPRPPELRVVPRHPAALVRSEDPQALAELMAPLCPACVMGGAAGHTCSRQDGA